MGRCMMPFCNYFYSLFTSRLKMLEGIGSRPWAIYGELLQWSWQSVTYEC
jgi:hypothetical protein